MKTLQELYDEIIKSDELKKAYAEAVKGDKLADFIKAQGCDATIDEVKDFLKEKMGADAPLSLDDLKTVAGGTVSTVTCPSQTCPPSAFCPSTLCC